MLCWAAVVFNIVRVVTIPPQYQVFTLLRGNYCPYNTLTIQSNSVGHGNLLLSFPQRGRISSTIFVALTEVVVLEPVLVLLAERRSRRGRMVAMLEVAAAAATAALVAPSLLVSSLGDDDDRMAVAVGDAKLNVT